MPSKPAFRIGQTAYLDGRDPQAQPPLTVGRIQLWKGVPRQKVRNALAHGTRVVISDRTYCREEKRWYYCVRRGGKQGWLPGVFLSEQREEPIGDVV